VVGILAAAFDARAAFQAFTGELALEIAALDAISLAGSGFAIAESRPDDPDHLASLQIDASPFAATALAVPVTDPAAFPIAGVVGTAHNGAGAFAEQGGKLGGILPILGTAKVCLYGACSSPVANLVVPISVVGQGGAATAAGAVDVTVIGAPWTTGTVSIGTVTAMGFARGPGSGATSTLQPSGSIRLVTPVFISTNIGAFSVVPAFGFLTLHFVPEPGTLLLVGAGVAALSASGARRRG
jgi:hypothetical protein